MRLDAARLGRSASLRAGERGRRLRESLGGEVGRFGSRARHLAEAQPLLAFGLALALGYALGCARRRGTWSGKRF